MEFTMLYANIIMQYQSAVEIGARRTVASKVSEASIIGSRVQSFRSSHPVKTIHPVLRSVVV
jgi:hypothetical protein